MADGGAYRSRGTDSRQRSGHGALVALRGGRADRLGGTTLGAIQAVHDYREPDLPALMRKFADIDLVFAQEEGTVYLSKFGHQRMPAARIQGEILGALRERSDLRIIATLREPGDKELYLFQRDPALEKL
jgi:hypothetical protein